MPVLLQVRDLKSRSLDVDFHEVSWVLANTSEDVLDYSFQVLRSESPSGPFDPISTPFDDRYLFIDNVVQIANRWRKYFYVLRVTQKRSGDSQDFGPITNDPDPDLIAKELRRHMQLLLREFAGRRAWVLPARTFGQRCFLPGTPMQGPVIGASRARYAGKVVQLTTKKGRRLTVTSNHPVLTTQGFTPAQAVRVGDDLVCYGHEVDGVHPGTSERDKQKGPALAEDVFRALAERTSSSTTRASGLDFHGEAQHFVGDVNVVGSYRDLLVHEQASSTQQAHEIVLEQTSSTEVFGCGLCSETLLRHGVYTPTGGFVRRGDLLLPRNGVPRAPDVVLRLGHSAQIESPLLECTTDSSTANTALVGELLHRGAGEVTLDQVVEVWESDFSGHVFDFETSTGWLIASDIFTSNCECWSATLQKRTRSGCRLCYDTGFVRGFMSPIEVWMQIDPSPKATQQTNVGEQQQSNTSARVGYYPPLKPRDIIIEPENRRWRVTQVSMTEHGRAPIHQELQLHEIPATDIEFAIPLNLEGALRDLWLNPSRNYTNPTNLENFEDNEIPKVFALYPNFPRQKL